MQCPKCRSQMFVLDETVNSRSQVTFYRCSLCVSEHVSSEPIVDRTSQQQTLFFALRGADRLGTQVA